MVIESIVAFIKSCQAAGVPVVFEESSQPISDSQGIDSCLDWKEKHGPLKIRWRYHDKEGEYIDDGCPYEILEATGDIECFYWTDGSLGCDCNRSRLFGLCQDEDNTFPCGDTIELVSIEEYKPAT